jgi:hypothetical protein
MTERLLQFIWQYQYFNSSALSTASGERLQIIKPGNFNSNQGPDFSEAKIIIEDTTWAGTIELHLKASDWLRHRHDKDPNYRNVILHVVWQNDAEVNDIPILELHDRVAKLLLHRYEHLMQSNAFIPCEKTFPEMPEIILQKWKETLLAERLLRKADITRAYLHQSNFHWEEVFWWMLARNFGITVNADAFEAVARSIPLSLLARQKNSIHHVEALLFGQGGLLESDFKDPYPILLKKEYQFLQNKHRLQPVPISLHFLRMRPGNFPTIRLAQLAMLIHGSVHLFSRIRDTENLDEVRELFFLTANDYWHYHYRFEEKSAFKKKTLGQGMINNIIINTIVPLLFAYGSYHGENKYHDKSLAWLEMTRAESNSVIEGFTNLGLKCRNAFDTQALLELITNYCEKRKCLTCAVGHFLLRE